ncbi:MAG: Kef-type K+ transport system membrane component KefB [Candidatus Saccharimonadales bacterium]|jgi:Kef-type K+ transport system membrane component KefB
MEHELFKQLSLIIAIGTTVALIMRLLRQPLIIGHILTGLIVGPTILGLVHDSESLTVFSDMGIALLLFLVGLGLNPKIIKEVGKVALFTGVGQVLFTTTIGFFLVSLLKPDLTTTATLYVAIGLAFSSTIIILKLLSDKKEQTRLHGKIATGFLLVQDVIATFALLFVSANGSGGLNTEDLILLAVKGAMAISALYILVKYVIPPLQKTIAGSQELLFLFSITWGLGIGAVFKESGFSLEVGALAAGVSLAHFSFAQEAGARLRPLRDFFIVLFFVTLGSQLDLSNIVEVLPAALVLSTFVLIGNPIIVMIIMGVLGYTKKTSFKTSLAVAQISEFSLVLLLLANKSGQISDATLSLMTVVGLITIAVSSYIILYDEKLYLLFERYLSLFERRKTKSERQTKSSNDLLLFGYRKGGQEFIKVFNKLNKRFAVVDYDPEVIDTLIHNNTPYLYGDMTDLELLEEAGIGQAKLIVSVVTYHDTNKFLVRTVNQINPNCVIICHADSADQASELYELGASYVMLPHFIGSEKIGSFIRKNGLSKSEFRKYRTKHIAYLESHFANETSED